MARFLGKRFIMLLSIAQIATMLFTTSISAESGKTEKNQQVVLPSGYYGNGMTINNVISGETLNWNPSGKATLVIDRPYTSGTISTSNAYDSGYNNGKNDALRSINPSVQNRFDMNGKRSFSFSTTSGSCYVVDMMLAGYFNAGECSISGGNLITNFQNNLSLRSDRWTTNIVLVLKANGGNITVTLGGAEAPGKGQYDRVSEAVVFKFN